MTTIRRPVPIAKTTEYTFLLNSKYLETHQLQRPVLVKKMAKQTFKSIQGSNSAKVLKL